MFLISYIVIRFVKVYNSKTYMKREKINRRVFFIFTIFLLVVLSVSCIEISVSQPTTTQSQQATSQQASPEPSSTPHSPKITPNDDLNGNSEGQNILQADPSEPFLPPDSEAFPGDYLDGDNTAPPDPNIQFMPPSTSLIKKIYVGSKKTKQYHYPSCEIAKKIAPEYEIWFDSVKEARSKGYAPCKQCTPP